MFEIDDILARLPALPVDETQQTDFKLPQGLVPPPRTGDTVSQLSRHLRKYPQPKKRGWSARSFTFFSPKEKYL
jgi:hypothetical protein